jgi:hydroxyacylglutathione hydrolase
MFIQQLYTKCLAEAAYYIESNGEAAVIDPLRDVEPYLQLAKNRGASIKYVFETHFHADFVSGHMDLSRETGASIVIGPTEAKVGYPAIIGRDGQLFHIGDITLKLLHTPGHTLESSCFLLLDEQGREKAVFTGDTLFIGDVGRPDLAQKIDAALTPEKLAGFLYDSLHNKLRPLPDEVIIYPGHGAGSACGKHMSKETTDTLGQQKLVNYGLNPALSKQMFIEQVLNGQLPPPSYFPQDVLMNIQGYESADKIMHGALNPLEPHIFDWEANNSRALIIDSRNGTAFAKGFVPGSINIGLDGDFAVWAATLVNDIKRPLLIVADPGREEEVVTRLLRVGCDHVLGFLEGGFAAWLASGKAFDTITSITVEEFAEIVKNRTEVILDVRTAAEFNLGHVHGAVNMPLNYIHDYRSRISGQQLTYVYCAAGYRSMAFVSLLQKEGYDHLVDVTGGFNALQASGQFNDLLASEPARNFCELVKK